MAIASPPEAASAPPLAAPSIGSLLANRARATPSREFLRFEGRSLTFRDVHQESARVAHALAALGIVPGDRVAIMLPNGLDFPLLWLGVVRLGAVVVPCNTGYKQRDLGFVLENSGARLAITDRERWPAIAEVRAACPALERVLVVGTLGDGGDEPSGRGETSGSELADPLQPLLAGAPAEWRDDAVGPDALATLQYTSGTTGFPKGCMLSHEYWLRLAAGAAGGFALREGDVNLVVTAWFYMDAGWNMLLCCIEGIPLVILPRFSASTFWRSVVDHGVTFFYCLGTMPIVLLKQPENPVLERGHRVRAVMCSAIPPALHAAIEARFACPWREAYSTTEIGSVCLTVPLEDTASVGSGAMGKPVPGSVARVVDAEGRDVPRGEAGQLLMRGPGMMLGYWKNPDATAAWLRDGWAHTGDLVFEDERGYYHLVGRTKDMIRRGGENISAVEVEAALAECEGVVASACVPVPDDIRGEEVKAYVQVLAGVSADAATAQRIHAFLRTRLAAFKVPRYVAFVSDFPLTPSQRIEKHKLARSPAGAFDALQERWT